MQRQSYPDQRVPQLNHHTNFNAAERPPFTPSSFLQPPVADFGPVATPGGIAPATPRPTPQPPALNVRTEVASLGKKRLFVIGTGFVLLVIVGVAVVAIRLLNSAPAVTLYQAGTQNVTRYVGGGGVVYPRQQLVVDYPTEEQAVKVLVKPGDTVIVDQPLIQLDPTQMNIQIKQAADEVTAAQAYLNSVSAGGTAVAIAQAQQQYDVAQSRYNALIAQYSSLTVHGGNLVAPMAGVVTEVDINSGEVFHADVPLLTIMDESTMIVRVKIPLSNLDQVHVGQSAVVTPSALPNVRLQGQVSTIIPQADPQTDTFEVWVNVSNPGTQLLPGMSAFVQIQNTGTALVVPRLAVINPDRDSAVFLFQNGHIRLQRVSVVGYGVGVLYIGQGLSAREKIVLVGLYMLHDGQKVRVVGIEQGGR